MQSWPEKWMITAYCLAWLFLVVVSVVIMIVLYSQVVYTLWFKPNDENPLNYQQQVSIEDIFSINLCIMGYLTQFSQAWASFVRRS